MAWDALPAARWEAGEVVTLEVVLEPCHSRGVCLIPGAAATRLNAIFRVTQGLRPGLNSPPPLRGWFLGAAFHCRQNAVLNTRLARPVLTITTIYLTIRRTSPRLVPVRAGKFLRLLLKNKKRGHTWSTRPLTKGCGRIRSGPSARAAFEEEHGPGRVGQAHRAVGCAAVEVGAGQTLSHAADAAADCDGV